MDINERLNLIRAKCRPRIDVSPVVKRKEGLIVRGSGKPTAYGIGPRLSPPDRVAEWVGQPEERTKEWQPTHRHEPHALNRIEERLRRR